MTTSNLRKYFNGKKPVGATTLLIFGILFILFGFLLDGGYLWQVLGAGISIGGIILIVRFCDQQSDDAVDYYCDEQATEYYETKKAIVDSYGEVVTDCIYSGGYCFENIFSARKAVKGGDNIWRSSIFEMSCIFFAENTVHYYNKKISLLTDEKAEKQKEFKIQDIAMVSLEEMNQSLVIAITIPGNEKIFINCKNKEEALRLCDELKGKMYSRGNAR